jgi:hypothetical protein
MRVVGMTTKLLVRPTLVMMNVLKEQKHLEETWASDNKEPDYVYITLVTALAAKEFEKEETIMTHVWGVAGVPLVYVIRHQLIPEDEYENPPFADKDTKYTSINRETVASAPILTGNANYNDDYEILETNGPFIPAFLTDSK